MSDKMKLNPDQLENVIGGGKLWDSIFGKDNRLWSSGDEDKKPGESQGTIQPGRTTTPGNIYRA